MTCVLDQSLSENERMSRLEKTQEPSGFQDPQNHQGGGKFRPSWRSNVLALTSSSYVCRRKPVESWALKHLVAWLDGAKQLSNHNFPQPVLGSRHNTSVDNNCW